MSVELLSCENIVARLVNFRIHQQIHFSNNEECLIANNKVWVIWLNIGKIVSCYK